MPSLQALEQFKSSFVTIGDELRILNELESPLEDFPLPPKTPDVPDPAPPADFDGGAADNAGAAADGDFFDGGLSDLLGGGSDPAAEDGEGAADAAQMLDDDGAAFGDFIDTIPDDFAAEADAMEDIAAEEAAAGENFDMAALLDGFADEMNADAGDEGGITPEEDEAFGDLALDNLPDFSIDDTEGADAAGGNDALGEDTLGETTVGEDDIDDIAFDDAAFGEDAFGEAAEAESPAGEFSLEGLDMGEAAPDDPPPRADADDLEEFSIDRAELDSGAGSPPAESGDDEDPFEFGEESPELDNTAVMEEISGDDPDSFDSFSLDGDAAAPAAGDSADNVGGSEFSLDDADNVFEGASEPANVSPSAESAQTDATGASEKSGTAATAAAAAKKAEIDDVEEIRLTNEEFQRLQETLATYPLNLRIACQELIAERAVDPAKMSRLINLLVNGAPAQEAAVLAGKLLDRSIPIPKGFEKKTGEALEAEQASFGYIFVHNFLPVFRLFILIALFAVSALYLGWRYIYNPIKADRIYALGIERIHAGEYARANERFWEAFEIKPRRSWFFEYARAFTEARQFTLAEQKYLELFHFTASKSKRGIPDKDAVLEYAHMVSTVLGHHERADRIIRQNLLDFAPDDRDGLLALGDNALAWGEYENDRYEYARESFARIMEMYGRSDPLLERMLIFFIRTDNLGEVLDLQSHFMSSERRVISAGALAEMGGYFLDKRMEEVRGVPNQYLEYIGEIRELLLRAIRQDPMQPEAYYHLARYYNYFSNAHDERLSLETALWVFDSVAEENSRRIRNHISALRRYGEILIANREFFRAEEYLTRGIGLYESGIARRLLEPTAEFGKLYALMGDMELFVREGDMQAALDYFHLAEQSGWSPPELQFRMGAAYYHMGDWGSALGRFVEAHREVPLNRRILHALANASFLRGNFFAAQGFYDQLLGMLYADRDRLPPIFPSNDPRVIDLVERIMVAQNNLGVTLEALSERTGNPTFRARAQGLYTDSARAWDILTRDPETMVRMMPAPDIIAPGINPGFLNVRNILNPTPDVEPLFFMRVDMDMFEISEWERLSPPGYRLSAGVGLSR
ncbi:MAG: tetratricopeptide repeat protein [Treponema sp.]|nr:tetratricopeptide repeat protein [Treponema sp.]